MEGHVWRIVCELLPQAQTNDGRVKCDLRSVLMLLLWSALNDRPRRWALEPSNWRFTPRPKHFISEGQLSRRARQQGVLNAMNRILSILSERLAELNATTSSLAFADGSCVAVGGPVEIQTPRPAEALAASLGGTKSTWFQVKLAKFMV